MPVNACVKIHTLQGKIFVSCCDKDLLGKTFSEGKCCLRVSESFYTGAEMSHEDACAAIMEHLDTADSIHVIGEGIVGHLVDAGVIGTSGVKRVQGVPHFIFMRM